MRGVMASNSSHRHNVQAPSRPAPRDRSPDAPVGRSGCCTGFLCLGSWKRGKRIVPATRVHDGSNTSPRPWASNGAPQSGGSSANQYASLSPSLLAPPSSPASFQNSAVQSSAQSPCSFPVASVPSVTSQIPLERAQTMFQMGPYAHETALVSPPVFSNFTTAPSTAPFTPPPELATHLTTPSSPDVPFAQLLANSFGTKQAVRLQPAPTHSPSPVASPDIFAADDLQAAYQLYPGSPLAHLLSPASGTGASTPFPDLEAPSPVQTVASMFFPGSPLTRPDPPSRMELEVCSFQEDLRQQGEQQLAATISSFLACGDDHHGPKVTGYLDLLIVDVKGSCEIQTAKQGLLDTAKQGLLEGNTSERYCLEEEKSAGVTGECIGKQEQDTGASRMELEVCSFQEDFRQQGEQELSATISSFLACGDDHHGPKVTGFLDLLVVDVKGSGEIQTPKQGLLEGNTSERDCLEEEKSPVVTGECIGKQEHYTGTSRMELEMCSFQEDLRQQGEEQPSVTISSFLACGGDPSGPKVTGFLDLLVVGVKGSGEIQTPKQVLLDTPKQGMLEGNTSERDCLEEETSTVVTGECTGKQEQDAVVTGECIGKQEQDTGASRMELEVCSFQEDLRQQGEKQLLATISSFLAGEADHHGPKVTGFLDVLVVDVKGSGEIRTPKQGLLEGNASERTCLEEEKSSVVTGECIGKQDKDAGIVTAQQQSV